MNIKDSTEYKGLGVLFEILLRISRPFRVVSKKISRAADRLKFMQYKMIFGERDEDIYVVTHPKSGTTLTQMILYQLTTEGGLDFDHIYDVSPWIRNASFRRQDPIDLPSPRIIKSHDNYEEFDKKTKGRFIFVYRDGMDVSVSLYHQNKNYNNKDLKFDKFVDSFIKSKSWFKYSKSWLKNKNKFPILYIRYEDLIEKKENEIQRIIEFCNIKSSEDQIQRALHLSSFETMKMHEDKFGNQPKEKHQVFNQFIREGKSGEGKVALSDNQQNLYKKHHKKILEPIESTVFGNCTR
ncbi:aryl sulfotransferase [Reichenbachiella faecimaris]|uniref:Aryl sulfotransferase n=1 Tax=Reichenbachiella faecimaris TaxID=692418 RepID=A0A1W2GK34_REIFA|nr:sulfotransferase domain-containing protein [Reichenbachiella faecimaris]SMD36708.1 aryl sulfotransferase [Reichenbachiella faecimaris]